MFICISVLSMMSNHRPPHSGIGWYDNTCAYANKKSQSSPSSELVRPVPVNSQDSPAEPEAGSSEKPLESPDSSSGGKTTYPDEKIEVLPTAGTITSGDETLDESVILSYMKWRFIVGAG